MIYPTAEDIKALRERHGLTREQLANSLYKCEEGTIQSYELGRRHCHPLTFWAMVMTWDKMDLRHDEERWIREYR